MGGGHRTDAEGGGQRCGPDRCWAARQQPLRQQQVWVAGSQDEKGGKRGQAPLLGTLKAGQVRKTQNASRGPCGDMDFWLSLI